MKIVIYKEDKGYGASCNVGDIFIATGGDDFEKLRSNILEGVQQLGNELTEVRFLL